MAIQRKPLSTDTIIAVAATITSICALIVTLYQTKLTREQQLKSVWPYLMIAQQTDEAGGSVIVSNNGVGPAIIQRIELEYDGKIYGTMRELVLAMFRKKNRRPESVAFGQTALYKGFVIPQGERITWMTVNGKEDNAYFWQQIQHHVKGQVLFQSIYGERWWSHFNDVGDIVTDE